MTYPSATTAAMASHFAHAEAVVANLYGSGVWHLKGLGLIFEEHGGVHLNIPGAWRVAVLWAINHSGAWGRSKERVGSDTRGESGRVWPTECHDSNGGPPTIPGLHSPACCTSLGKGLKRVLSTTKKTKQEKT